MLEFDINYIFDLEKKYGANSFDGTPSYPIKYVYGKNPILISSPHAVNQIRNGKLKMGERYTGAIGEVLSKELNCHFVSKIYNNGIDDNYILNTDYKNFLGKIIEKHSIIFVLDLHGMLSSTDKGFRGYHIEIGTNDGKNLLDKKYIQDILIECLISNNICDIKLNYKFKASKPFTISNYIANVFHTPSLQLEISSDYRNPIFNFKNFRLLIKALIDFLNKILIYY